LRKFLSFLLKGIIGLAIAFAVWVLFFYFQQLNYTEPDQVYLSGTIFSQAFVFLFLCIVVFFVSLFIRYRHQPDKIKRLFLLFTFLYLLSSPLVLLAFDNYLLVTRTGINYNEFWGLEDAKVKRWQDIDQVVLDYRPELLPFSKSRYRLVYIVRFKDGQTVDLNNYNSPLYDAKQFKAIHRTMIKQGVPVKIRRPLPSDANPQSFLSQMYHLKP
jgi:hypothetical protein